MQEYKARPYQQYATQHIIKNQSSGLFLDMGLGKTVATLTAINELMYDYFTVGKVLVIAPVRVARKTWPDELKKWEHLKNLSMVCLCGTAEQRRKALNTEADIYTIGRENVVWLVKTLGKAWPFDMVVIDELSSFKSSKAQRFRALKRIPQSCKVVGLTGTPGNLMDLWAEMYLLDKGERLGKTITGFRDTYFNPGRRNGHIVYEWVPKVGAEEKIYQKISDICISMKSEDYISLPERLDYFVEVELSSKTQELCAGLRKKQQIELGETITASNAAVVSGMLQQLANGAIYAGDDGFEVVHDEKLNALEDIIESANGAPVLVFYQFIHDVKRILERFPDARKLDSDKDIDDWNAGEISIALAHPRSAGHGLNLQAGGHIAVWFGLDWWLEGYQQANKRLYRSGQEKPFLCYHIIAKNTIDEDIKARLTQKAITQDEILEAVRARLEG